MLASPVARVYAEALFGIAKDRGAADTTGEELQAFVEIVRKNDDIATFLGTPVIEPEAKVALLRKALEGRASDVLADFLSLLVERRRTSALEKIADAYRQLEDEHAHRSRALVRTARPLGDSIRAEIERTLKEALAREVLVEVEVDPALMGGAVVRVGDKVYDGSIRNRLVQFRKQIMRSGGYEAQV